MSMVQTTITAAMTMKAPITANCAACRLLAFESVKSATEVGPPEEHTINIAYSTELTVSSLNCTLFAHCNQLVSSPAHFQPPFLGRKGNGGRKWAGDETSNQSRDYSIETGAATDMSWHYLDILAKIHSGICRIINQLHKCESCQ